MARPSDRRGSSTSFARSSRRRQQHRTLLPPLVEQLEDGRLLATFSVVGISAPSLGAGIVVDGFDVEGKPDVATSSISFPSAFVVMRDGSRGLGTFTTLSIGIASPRRLSAIASGNLNANAAQELGVATGSSDSRFLSNDGAGSFSVGADSRLGSTLEHPAIADINGNGQNDVVVGRFRGNGIAIV